MSACCFKMATDVFCVLHRILVHAGKGWPPQPQKRSYFTRIWALLLLFGLHSRIDAARYAAIVTDFSSGTVLAEKDSDVKIYPASLTKMMTLYLVFEALSKKKITLSQGFKMSLKASQQPPCKWGVCRNQKIPVRQCIAILATRSANDIAMGIAENMAPSVKDFVCRMNAKARTLGMHNTHFCNPSGWHDSNQRTTARDISILLRALCMDFPQYAGALGLRSILKGKKMLPNTNKLLGRVSGVVLGKTGYTCPAGWNLAALTQRKTGAIISVVMGMHSNHARNQHMTNLIETFYQAPHTLHMAVNNPSGLKTLAKKPDRRCVSTRSIGPRLPGMGKSSAFKKQTIRLGHLTHPNPAEKIRSSKNPIGGAFLGTVNVKGIKQSKPVQESGTVLKSTTRKKKGLMTLASRDVHKKKRRKYVKKPGVCKGKPRIKRAKAKLKKAA